MDEASKTNRFRTPEFFNTYFSGAVLDIGAGQDLVCPHAKGFDLIDGDANLLDEYFPPGSFDTVNSSHSLEHMHDPVDALTRWWKLVKLGGHLVIVVPDEDMYEQGIWPSAFNADHKSTFRLNKVDSWSPVSYDIEKLCSSLAGSKVISAAHQSYNYDHSLILPSNLTPKRRYTRWQRRAFSILKRLPGGSGLVKNMQKKLVKKGHPIDQTRYDASAQIEVIVQKLIAG
jgi:SAM-dependent methyltransferase